MTETTTEKKLDAIHRDVGEVQRTVARIDERTEAQGRAIEGLEVAQRQNGEAIARLSERSKGQEKRMDRADQRSGVIGFLTGGGAAGLVHALKRLFGGGNGP